MRFEIKTGGVIAILMGVAVLSGAVFVLGLLAGYDVGRESQLNTAQTAETYTVTPPAPAASPVQSLSQANAAAPGIETVSRDTHATVPSAPPAAPISRTAPTNPVQRTASNQPPSAPAAGAVADRSTATSANNAPARNANSAPQRTASAQPPTAAPAEARPVRRRPYNIQIEAAMDINGADAMMMRLQKLGYTPHLTTTNIDGHTWFKVEVGPYATEQEAEQAQAELREKYDAAYAPHSQNRASDNDSGNPAGDDSQ
jgi:septal ring-binding cell division protein DamX